MRETWFTYKGVDFIVTYEGGPGEWVPGALYVDEVDEPIHDIWDLVLPEVQDKACEEIDMAISEGDYTE